MKSNGVSPWYFYMLNDELRLTSFRAEIDRVKFPGAKIIDVGSGFGVLGGYAARKNDCSVLLCERNEYLLNSSKKIYSDLSGLSFWHGDILNLSVAQNDLFDIAIVELVGSNLIGEGFVETFKFVKNTLLCGNGKILPYRVYSTVQIVDWSMLHLAELFDDRDTGQNFVAQSLPSIIPLNDRGDLRSCSEKVIFDDISMNDDTWRYMEKAKISTLGEKCGNGVLFETVIQLDEKGENTICSSQPESHWQSLLYIPKNTTSAKFRSIEVKRDASAPGNLLLENVR